MQHKVFKSLIALSMVLMMLVALTLPSFAAPIKLTVDLYDEFQWSVSAFTYENGVEHEHKMSPGFSGDWTYYVKPNVTYNGVEGCTEIKLNYPLPFDGFFVIKSAKHLPLNPGYNYTLNNKYAINSNVEPYVLAYKMYYGDSSNNVLYEDEIFTDSRDGSSQWQEVNSIFKVRDEANITQCAFAVGIVPFQNASSSDNWSYITFTIAFTDFYFEIDDPTLNPGIFEPPTSNAWDDSKEEMSSIMGELPNSSDVELSNVDMSDFGLGLNVIRLMFNNLVDKTGLSSLIVFVLTFSLGVYLIGRKVG